MMRVNKRRSELTRHLALPVFGNLLNFLNGPAPKERNRRQVWKRLHHAAGAVAEYNRALGEVRQKLLPFDRDKMMGEASRLYEMVMTDVHAALSDCEIRILPGTCSAEYNLLVSKDQKISDREFLEGAATPFVSGMPFLRSMPQHGQYALDFLSLLSHPKIGMVRFSRCEYEKCRKFFFSSYQRLQRYCLTRCRNAAGNLKKASEMKLYMQQQRRRDALRAWTVSDFKMVDWKRELHEWNAKHPKMKYRRSAEFRKDISREQNGPIPGVVGYGPAGDR